VPADAPRTKLSANFSALWTADPDELHDAIVVLRPPSTLEASLPPRLRDLKARLDAIKAMASKQHEQAMSLADEYHRDTDGSFAAAPIGGGGLPVMAAQVTQHTLQGLAERDDVVAIMPNQRVHAVRPHAIHRDDPFQEEVDSGMTWGLQELNIPDIWATTRGDGARVAVLDTGVDAAHPSLGGRVEEFTVVDPIGRRIDASPAFDAEEHGTHVCGTIAGGEGADGVKIGVAPECRLLVGAILLGGSTTHTLIEGISWAIENDANVVSMSLGFPSYEEKFDAILDRAIRSDLVPVASVGNDCHGSMGSPGSSPLALSVGAAWRPEGWPSEVADFSGGASLVFPGARPTSVTKPDIVAPGKYVYSCIPRRKDRARGLVPDYARMEGTSMAAPHVAGVAALLMAAKPEARAERIIEVLKETADHPTGYRPDNRWGYGMLDPVAALAMLSDDEDHDGA